MDRDEGVWWWQNDGGWSRTTIRDSNDVHNNCRTHQWTGGAWDVLVSRRDGNQAETENIEFWQNDGGSLSLEAEEDLYKEVERLPIGDIDADGNDEFVTVSEFGHVEYWSVNQ